MSHHSFITKVYKEFIGLYDVVSALTCSLNPFTNTFVPFYTTYIKFIQCAAGETPAKLETHLYFF